MGMIWIALAVDEATAEGIKTDPAVLWDLEEKLAEENDPRLVDLDKAWHGIHWLLTGSVGEGERPLADAIFGGEEFGEDNGYGRPRHLCADCTAKVHAALSALDDAELMSRYDGAAMNAAELYPVGIWEKDGHEYTLDHLAGLRAFYAYAAARGLSVIQQIT
ncbi:YfbM family protein [Nocardioides sp. NPDC127503]|uniref:YfbM family protein n=1 Tax=Nocardioides sp. NPDC127503 TaxID=3154516 RepID=UPI00331C05C5